MEKKTCPGRNPIRTQNMWLMLIGVLMTLSVISCDNRGELVEKIEAEDCGLLGKRCTLTGPWKKWEDSQFSEGALLHNEEGSGEAKAANVSLTLEPFEGDMVCITYRQDVWYGSLFVKITEYRDERAGTEDQNKQGERALVEKFFKQKGKIKNQVEICAEIPGGNGSYTLILEGKKKAGVITVDDLSIYKKK